MSFNIWPESAHIHVQVELGQVLALYIAPRISVLFSEYSILTLRFLQLGGWLYGVGLEKGCVGGVFWALAGMAIACCVASTFVREGDGHEIRLEGDDEAEEEAERANRALR